MIGFPVDELLSEEECYKYLKRSLHPEGLSCPNGHDLPDDQAPHDRRRAPIVDYRCRECGAVFNIFTNTVWSKTHYDPSTIVMLLRGFAKGVPTKHLTDKMHLAYPSVLKRRHRIQEAVGRGERVGLPGEASDELPDPEVEADEMYQNAGKKGKPHRSPDDPPRRRANKARGRGTYKNDRPPVLGMVGRESGWARFRVCVGTKEDTIRTTVAEKTAEETCIFTDENRSYLWLENVGESRTRKAVDHSEGWAEDRDGDGIREVHINTIEGIWTSLRNRLRRFRGVHKKHLSGYVAMFELAFNHDQVTPTLLQRICGV
jgi:transposase-like protein